MKSTSVRQLRKEFRESKAPAERKHTWVKPASLIVNSAEDPTTLFNTAGMQQFVPYLMGKPHPAGKRIYNIQWCVRTGDIDEVGDSSHLTFFEMMGNRWLGDYFKKESIAWSREFLTWEKWLNLDPRKICVTVFEWDENAPRDEESANIRRKQGVPDHKIAYLNKKENWRGPAGKTWPCGPDTEIFYRVGEGEFPPEWSNTGNDEENRMEIWNNVFMAYYKAEDWKHTELTSRNVDTGMWFERICLVKQAIEEGKPLKSMSVYDIDIFADMMKVLDRYLIHPYPTDTVTDLDKKVARSYRIVADHLRTGIFLVDEWLIPSNEGRGYVLRRILRRGYYHILKMHREGENRITNGLVQKILEGVIDALIVHYPHLKQNKNATLRVIFEEMKQFQSTIDKGEKRLQEMFAKQEGETFSGKDAFVLYDTYGVPVELTAELVADNNLVLDMEWFEKAMQEAKQKSRTGSKQMFAKGIDRAQYIEWLPPTTFVWYEQLEIAWCKILKDFTIKHPSPTLPLEEREQKQRILVFDKTPFYAEWGGQKGDKGKVVLDDGETVAIKDVQKYGGVYLHFVE